MLIRCHYDYSLFFLSFLGHILGMMALSGSLCETLSVLCLLFFFVLFFGPTYNFMVDTSVCFSRFVIPEISNFFVSFS